MGNGSARVGADGRLLIEILDIDRPLESAIAEWVTAEVRRRRISGDFAEVQAWFAISDDTGELGNERCRVVLLQHPANPTDSPAPALSAPEWLTKRHIYNAAPVSSMRAPGRPDPVGATGLRFVAMNCAEGAEDEFHAWYEEDHLPKFSQVQGVLEGRRLHSPDSPRRHLALYWLDDIAVVGIPEWKAAAGTDWTTEMRKKTFDRDRINLVPFESRLK